MRTCWLGILGALAACTTEGSPPADGGAVIDGGQPDARTDGPVADGAMGTVPDGATVDGAAVDGVVGDSEVATDAEVTDRGAPRDAAAPDAGGCAEGSERPCDPACPTAVERCAGGAWQACARPAEACNRIDDDCDGTTDEGFPVALRYLDRDGDGVGASAGTSCASLAAEGVVEDGVYDIQPGGPDGPALAVYCDMTGGGWTRVFHHDVAAGYFASDADARARSEGDPLSPLYSILNHIEYFRSSDGHFDLRIDWPGTAIQGGNIWRQLSDPTTAPVQGYQPIAITYTAQFWGGLELSDRAETYLDGSVGHANWFYSIGSQVPWNNPPGIPAHTPPAERVALWVRPDDAVAGGAPVLACAAPGLADVGGDCDDTHPAVAPGAEERCDGLDNDCDGQADEQCPPGDLALTSVPQPLHFYARDRDDRCTFTIEGEVVGAATATRVTVTRDGLPFAEIINDDARFAIPVIIEAGLSLYDVAVAWDDGNDFWRPVTTVEDVVCGDVFLIDGQSNAVAGDYQREGLGDRERNTFVRSYGSSVLNATVVNDRAFDLAVADTVDTHAAIGQWGLRLANRIKDAESVPILVINGAYGGTRIDQHQRNDANPEDVTTIYGRLLWRARQAGVAEHVRAIFWHQGESDGAQPYAQHLALWTAMHQDWLEDYPNVEAIFPFQVRAGCGGPTWNRNVHRELPTLLPRIPSAMSTTGIGGHDGCHFFHRTYAEWGERMARIVQRDLYGRVVPGNIDAPNPQRATWISPTELEIEYGETGNGMLLQPGAEAFFSLQGGAAIVSARVEGTAVILTTAAPSQATWVSFVDVAGDIPWLVNDLGIGGFAYHQFPITP